MHRLSGQRVDNRRSRQQSFRRRYLENGIRRSRRAFVANMTSGRRPSTSELQSPRSRCRGPKPQPAIFGFVSYVDKLRLPFRGRRTSSSQPGHTLRCHVLYYRSFCSKSSRPSAVMACPGGFIQRAKIPVSRRRLDISMGDASFTGTFGPDAPLKAGQCPRTPRLPSPKRVPPRGRLCVRESWVRRTTSRIDTPSRTYQRQITPYNATSIIARSPGCTPPGKDLHFRQNSLRISTPSGSLSNSNQ